MSTYTDLHNRIKEGVAVDSRTRITPQPVKLLNEQNEYWGTLVGTLEANDVAVKGGTIKNVVIENAELRHVKGLDGLDLDTVSKTVFQMSSDLYTTLPEIEDKLIEHQTEILSVNQRADLLSSAISDLSDHIDERVDHRIYEVSCQLTSQLCAVGDEVKATISDVSASLSARIEEINIELQEKIDADIAAEASARISVDTEISNDVSAKYETFLKFYSKEYEDRVYGDWELSNAIVAANVLTIEKFTAACEALSIHSLENDAQFAFLTEYMLSTVEHDRHYKIIETNFSNKYPLPITEFAVNKYDVELPDAVVYDSQLDAPDRKTPVGYIYQETATEKFPFKFKTYDINDKLVYIALDSNTAYPFTNASESLNVKNRYTLEFADSPDHALSNSNFRLIPHPETYHDVWFGNNIIAKVTNVLSTVDNDILSGLIKFSTAGTELSVIDAEFPFNNGELSTWHSHLSTEEIIYDGHDTFEIRTNISEKKYFLLKSNDEISSVFGAIYENGGILSDDEGKISAINIELYSPLSTNVTLDVSTGLSTVLSTDPMNIVVMSCELSDDEHSGKFSIVDIQEKYEYSYFKELSAHEDANMMGKIKLPIINSELSDKQFDTVEVDTTSVYILPEFKGNWTLSTADHELWKLHHIDGDTLNTMDILFDGEKLSVDSFEYKKSAYIHRQYDVDPATKTVYNVDDCVKTIHETEFVDFSYDNSRPMYLSWKPITIDHRERSIGGKQYQLDIVTDAMETDTIQFQIPSKSPDMRDISREFMAVIRVTKPDIAKKVNIQFVDENRNPVYIINQRHQNLILETNEWTTLQLNELGDGKFLVTDLDENEEDWKIEDLTNRLHDLSGEVAVISSDLLAQIQSNDDDIAKLSADLSSLSAESYALDKQISDDFRAADAYISGVVDSVSVGLSTTLSNTIADLATLSTDVDSLEERYYNTLSSIDRKDDAEHIMTDNLLVTDYYGSIDHEHGHQKYYMTFLSGTLVLKPID